MRNLTSTLQIAIACGVFCFAAHADSDLFRFSGENNILEEDHFGIVNGWIAAGTPYSQIAAVRGLWAPPYASSDFALNMSVNGKPVATTRYDWNVREVNRSGPADALKITATTLLAEGKRAGLLRITLLNDGALEWAGTLGFSLSGSADKIAEWQFARPASQTAAPAAIEQGIVLKRGNEACVGAFCSEEALTWKEDSWTGPISLLPGKTHEITLGFALGTEEEVAVACRAMRSAPEQSLQDARAGLSRRTEQLFDRLPKFECDNPELTRLYNRSLVHFLTNRWEADSFLLKPYYSTGSINGGCVCNYLWNFGEIWELLPLYEPEALKSHVRQFLKVNLTQHFSFNPLTGEGQGPWYMVNQEKIIGLVYYYVALTGDRAFLDEIINGKTILDLMVEHATVLEDLSKPVALIDYGPSNSHLELRKSLPYNHVMPDLNGRRYMNYMRTVELCHFAGKPRPDLATRAEDLKDLLKRELWSPEPRWFKFRDDAGKEDVRYTVQIFKLFGSGVLNDDQTQGLLSHLNENEFLSEHGLHSLAKQDPAYDPADVDNGGPGACTSFPPQIAERLYRSGQYSAADDIIRRILWWGKHTPYWGDSMVAERIDYRKDTPLQCTVDGVAVAQSIIFGMFGVEVGLDGQVTVRPHCPHFVGRMSLTGLKIRGNVYDIVVHQNGPANVLNKSKGLSKDIPLNVRTRIDE